MHFNNISMTKKLPASFVVLTLLVTLCISFMGYRDFKQALNEVSAVKLEILTRERSKAITTWFESIELQVAAAGSDPNILKAVQGFNATFGLTMTDPTAELQKAYIEDNPNPIGEKHLLARAPDAVPYNAMHEAFHPFFRKLKSALNLYDVFLFDLNGNLVYSVFKEADFATNFETGPYMNSGLGDAYRAAKADATDAVQFVDFRPYGPSADAPASFMSTSILNPDGKQIGIFAIQLPAETISGIVTNADGLGQTADLTLIAEDFRARTDSRFEGRHEVFDLMEMPDHIKEAIEAQSGQYVNQQGLYGDMSIGHVAQVDVLGKTWAIIGEINSLEVHEAAILQRNKTIIFSTISLIVIAMIGWIVSNSLTRPLTSIVKSMEKISNRDYDIDLSGAERGDEIGDLSRALEAMSQRSMAFDRKTDDEKIKSQNQEFAVTALGAALQQLANGNLTYRLEEKFSDAYEPLRKDFNETVENLKSTIAELIQFSSMINSQTAIMSTDASDLARRTEAQAATLEETAAAVDQITCNVKSSVGDLQSAETLITEANNKAKLSRKVATDTTNAMSKIEKTSNEIEDIVGVVDDIAFQTNLLALNAGVEAARAGETGQGFAVVASEVRSLAQRTSEAVGRIKGLIENSGRAVRTGVDLVGDTEDALVEIEKRIDSVSNLVTTVTATSNDQSESLGEINTGVNQLDQATQQNVSMVEKSDATAQKLKSEALKLAQMLTSFDLGDLRSPEPVMPSQPSVAEQPPLEVKDTTQAGPYKTEDDWEEWVA